ncbi:hypothetical protein TUM19329_16960 [Legionella antarctica]|uniref:Transposase Tn5-like N-terminal domain-containing protein n=1 Tax=Legionella antarctica TaxID=2708020 RepID=A0A6F8T3S7_9GAMM|nr:hypothetical protein TUM19329_16960 [Legionella antarctica]
MIKFTLLFLNKVSFMNSSLSDSSVWSEALFGGIELGDKRLTKRLVQIGNQLSSWSGSSLSQSSLGDEALVEGGYRILRNHRVKASQIASGGYDVTGQLAKSHELLLAIEDATSLVYSHELSKQLGYTSNNPHAKAKGYQVHSTILMDAATEKTIGLIAQNRWCRNSTAYGKVPKEINAPIKIKKVINGSKIPMNWNSDFQKKWPTLYRYVIGMLMFMNIFNIKRNIINVLWLGLVIIAGLMASQGCYSLIYQSSLF